MSQLFTSGGQSIGVSASTSVRPMNTQNCGVGEDSEGPLDCREIHPVHPEGDQFWVFIGTTDAETETAILWPPDAKS